MPEFQSTPPVKAATLNFFVSIIRAIISIHAAREGGDTHHPDNYVNNDISIHAAREGGDINGTGIFSKLNISIHAAREGGDVGLQILNFKDKISIHAAREGGDVAATSTERITSYFNPRRP